MESQNVFVDPDQNFPHVIILLEHRAVLYQQREILCQVFIGIEEHVERFGPITCRLQIVSLKKTSSLGPETTSLNTKFDLR